MRRRHRRADHRLPGGGARDDREQVEPDRGRDPLPVHRRERVAEVAPVRPVPPEERGRRRRGRRARSPRAPTASVESVGGSSRRDLRVDLLEALGDPSPTSSARAPSRRALSPSDAPARLVLEQPTSASASAASSPGGTRTPVLLGHDRPVPGNVGGDDRDGAGERAREHHPEALHPGRGRGERLRAQQLARSAPPAAGTRARRSRRCGTRCRASRSPTASGSAPTSRSRAPVRRCTSGQALSSTGMPLRGSWRPMKTIVLSRSAGSASGGIRTPFGITSKSHCGSQRCAESARLLGDCDPVVDPVEQEPPGRQPDAHPPEPAGRVPGGDDRALRDRERRDADSGRHRLVQVEDVEPLAREHPPQLEGHGRAEDDVRQRAVGGDDHGPADGDDVGRGLAVAAVARVERARERPGRVVADDDPHVVARAAPAPRPGARRARARRPRTTTRTARRCPPSSSRSLCRRLCSVRVRGGSRRAAHPPRRLGRLRDSLEPRARAGDRAAGEGLLGVRPPGHRLRPARRRRPGRARRDLPLDGADPVEPARGRALGARARSAAPTARSGSRRSSCASTR